MQKSLAFLEALSDASPVDPLTLNYSRAVRPFFCIDIGSLKSFQLNYLYCA